MNPPPRSKITLKTLSEATPQEVFDQVAEHLLKQMRRSLTYNTGNLGTCVYRSDQGLACAAGCLIADDEYVIAFERHSWNTLVNSGRVPNAHVQLIRTLQDIHDTYKPDMWSQRLHHVANVFKLLPYPRT